MPLVPPDTSPMGAAPTGGGPFWDPAGDYEEGFHPRWTFEAGALMLHRSRPEHAVLMSDAFAPGGNVLVDAADFDFDFRGGFEVGLVHRNLLGSIWDLEARYFRVDGWQAALGPIVSPGGAVVHYVTPVGNTAFPATVSGTYASHLDSLELNLGRPVLGSWLSVFGGFRFLELDERSLTFTQDVGPGLNLATFDNGAINDLYGFQLGADARLWRRGPLSVECLVKAGVYDNRAVNRVAVAQQVGPAFSCRAQTDRAAFVGETALTAAYRFGDGWAVRAGYQLLWLEGMATASNQIAASDPVGGTARVDASGGLFYHGALVSLEFSR